jgi:DNA-binding MarR family transcriptional regulator
MSDGDPSLRELIERHAEGELTVRQVAEEAGVDYYEALEAIGEWHRQRYDSEWDISPEQLREGGSDLNERVKGEWKTDTTPTERVRRVMKRMYEPQSISAIAEQALVSEKRARMHLDRFVEDGFVIEVGEDSEERQYQRSSESIIREGVEHIRDSTNIDTLEERIEELRETVRGYQQCDEMTDERIVEWQTAFRNLVIAETALEFAQSAPVDGESPPISKGAIRVIEQINRGESVAKEDLLDELSELSDSDAGN